MLSLAPGTIYAVGGQRGFRQSSPEDNLATGESFEPGGGGILRGGTWTELKGAMSIVRGPVRATIAVDINS